VGKNGADRRALASTRQDQPPVSATTLHRQTSKVGAECVSSARSDLSGGRGVTRVPTGMCGGHFDSGIVWLRGRATDDPIIRRSPSGPGGDINFAFQADHPKRRRCVCGTGLLLPLKRRNDQSYCRITWKRDVRSSHVEVRFAPSPASWPPPCTRQNRTLPVGTRAAVMGGKLTFPRRASQRFTSSNWGSALERRPSKVPDGRAA
jgi:hypothetical protein